MLATRVHVEPILTTSLPGFLIDIQPHVCFGIALVSRTPFRCDAAGIRIAARSCRGLATSVAAAVTANVATAVAAAVSARGGTALAAGHATAVAAADAAVTGSAADADVAADADAANADAAAAGHAGAAAGNCRGSQTMGRCSVQASNDDLIKKYEWGDWDQPHNTLDLVTAIGQFFTNLFLFSCPLKTFLYVENPHPNSGFGCILPAPSPHPVAENQAL